jgi:putative hydrolase of the HAD superfamily
MIRNQSGKPGAIASLLRSAAQPIKAVTFDAGGTLIEPWPSVGHIYSRVAATHGIAGASPARLNQRFRIVWRQLSNFDYSRRAWRCVVNETFLGAGTPAPDRDCFDDLYRRFAQPDVWRVFRDVLPTLEALAGRGVRLGIISNWDERLRPLLGRLDLLRHFSEIVVSAEAGVTKPSRRIFELAARRLQVPRESVLHIGDSPSLDFRAARAAGLSSLLLRRGVAPGRNRISSLLSLRGLPSPS